MALAGNGSRRKLELESFWPHKGRIVLKFVGVESILEAESLIGCELQILARQRADLESDSAYVSDLVGCAVWNDDRQIGRVSDVRFDAGEAPLLVVSGAQQYEIPFAKAFLEKLDLADKQIWMRLPEGMLHVNAPLTEEEKKRHKEGS